MHYVCTGGCQGVAEQPGTCQAESCKDYHKDLKPCDCEDGQHTMVMASAQVEEAEDNQA